MKVTVVGAGLTGATAAYALGAAGHEVTVYEAAHAVGGHVRTSWLGAVPFEPNGAHIFHTNDDEVWSLASSMVDFVPYEHQVLAEVDGDLFSWPIQRSEIHRMAEADQIEAELAALPPQPNGHDFETWCLSMMGPTLYEKFIRDYTAKQWGRPAHELDTSFAPKRIELRDDGHKGLFRDRHQGWPRLGYTALVEQLIIRSGATVHMGSGVQAADLKALVPFGSTVIVTCPLDSFFAEVNGPLEWRGVRFESTWMPGVKHHQQAMVVNRPGGEVPWTRSIETKHALPELDDEPGTVVQLEFPGADAKHYPVPDRLGLNATRQRQYLGLAAAWSPHRLICAGRLAGYTYINMDEAMRQGLDAAARAVTPA